jgi:ParB/RepB/Spo0J family partition protein
MKPKTKEEILEAIKARQAAEKDAMSAAALKKAEKDSVSQAKALAKEEAEAARLRAVQTIKERETMETVTKELLHVDPRNVVIQAGFNTRINYGKLHELKNKIIANGVHSPLKGFDDGNGKFILTDGHRRMAAIQLAIEEGHDIKLVPFIPSDEHDDVSRTLEILLSNDGKPLTTLETAHTYKRLTSLGLKVSEVATKVGKSYAYVNKLLILSNATETTQAQIKEGKVSAWTVLEALKKDSPENVEENITAIIDTAGEGKSSIEVKAEIKRQMVAKATYTRTEVDAIIKDHLNNIVAMLVNGDSVDDIADYKHEF